MRFSMQSLESKIERATRAAFREVHEKHGKHGIYAFALYSDENAQTVCPATNSLAFLATRDPADKLYKFDPCEWKYEMVGAKAAFDAICKTLDDKWQSWNDGQRRLFTAHRNQLYETCISILERLQKSGFFRKIVGKDIYVTFTAYEHDFTNRQLKAIVARLNDNEYKAEYLAWMKTWGQ